jgi:hypothetical protein
MMQKKYQPSSRQIEYEETEREQISTQASIGLE